MEQDRSIVVFPEGTRSKNGELGKFKGGAMKIAMETGAKIVPVYLEGTRECFEETGNISFLSLTRIAVALDAVGDIKRIFTDVPYKSIQEVINEQKKKHFFLFSEPQSP